MTTRPKSREGKDCRWSTAAPTSARVAGHPPPPPSGPTLAVLDVPRRPSFGNDRFCQPVHQAFGVPRPPIAPVDEDDYRETSRTGRARGAPCYARDAPCRAHDG